MSDDALLQEGSVPFTVESRLIRELGERLVKQADVALLELVKNSYDADAMRCKIEVFDDTVVVTDDGIGMTVDQFLEGWMRIGSASKVARSRSPRFQRDITGEKGIGRFAVRFLGRKLVLRSVAYDKKLGRLTELSAKFNWPVFDSGSELGTVTVPYELREADPSASSGTRLTIAALRVVPSAESLRSVRTSSFGMLSPYSVLLAQPAALELSKGEFVDGDSDPGFALDIVANQLAHEGDEATEVTQDVAEQVLKHFVLRALLTIHEKEASLRLFKRGDDSPLFEEVFAVPEIGTSVFADIRFFPRRKGTFTNLSVDGRLAKGWVTDSGGVAVFDRAFRILPYGDAKDDWLKLAADVGQRQRNPRSSIAKLYFPMDDVVRNSTKLNYMLRLPRPNQLVGVVQVRGTRAAGADHGPGLYAAADREGFVANESFDLLWDLVRGATEAIAYFDRQLQLEANEHEARRALEAVKTSTAVAIDEIRNNSAIPADQKPRLIKWIADTGKLAEQHEERSKERQAALETMSLLGIVSGFMTHEFGTAMSHIAEAQKALDDAATRLPEIADDALALAAATERLQEYVKYSKGYILGASHKKQRPYTARSRIQQVLRVFGDYATKRAIALEVDVDKQLMGPSVPISLYSGVVLNLYSNALKAVTASIAPAEKRIVFRAWNSEGYHWLQVSDSGIGIPEAIRERVFEPLFTTTASGNDPLGSGMGLGLALVKRCVEAFSGKVEVVDAPPGFTTCFSIRFRLEGE